MTDDLERQIRELVSEHTGVRLEKLDLATDVVNGTGIYGDDVWELIEEFGKEFAVDVSEFRNHWYHHTGAEGCAVTWWFVSPWWTKKKYIPIRIGDLVESAKCGRWIISYPQSPTNGMA